MRKDFSREKEFDDMSETELFIYYDLLEELKEYIYNWKLKYISEEMPYPSKEFNNNLFKIDKEIMYELNVLSKYFYKHDLWSLKKGK